MGVSINKQGVVTTSGNIGQNLVVGTQVPSYVSGSVGSRAAGKLGADSGGNGTFAIVEDTTVPVGKYSFNVLNNTSGNRDYQQDQIPYIAGKKYTGSWWAKGSGTCLYRVWNCTQGSQPMSATFTLTESWKYYTHTFTATQEMETDNCTFHLGVTGTASIYICGMKLEEGSIATPWIPAPEDNIYVTDASGFNEVTNIAAVISKIAQNSIVANEFIEW